MHVALVCPYALDAPGGVQDQVFRLAVWLEGLGHTTSIIGPASGPVDGVQVVGKPTTVKANDSTAPIALDPRIRSDVVAAIGDADVVHIHEPFVPFVSLAATRVSEKPTVGTFHADASKAMRRSLSIAGPLTRGLASRLDVKTAVSPVARSSVASLKEVRIVPNGIDTSAYRSDSKLSNSVVFLGRDDPRKGLDVLLEAWPIIRSRSPYATLDILGARRDEEHDGVTFHGRVDGQAKIDLLARSAVYVAPNLGGESFGIILAEGMASGCAMVASALPAFVKVIGDAGVLVPPGDPHALADAVVGLLGDDSERSRLSDLGLERVKRYDGPVVAAQYVEAYEDAIESHGLRQRVP